MWCETLKDYSLQEFDKAVKNLITHPPKYELEDGSIQVWRGMPKLPDVVSVMLENREEEMRKRRLVESERRNQELRQREKRRQEHPEEFFGWEDLLKEFENKIGPFPRSIDRNGKMVPMRGWPQEPKELTDAEYEDRKEMLRQQKKMIESKYQTSESSDKAK